jgi:hypothetical protein
MSLDRHYGRTCDRDSRGGTCCERHLHGGASRATGILQDMLRLQTVTWDKESTALLAGGSTFFMATGHMEAKDTASCRAYLEFLGSRLVFLIDWNQARKQLRGFLRGPDRVALLSWAGENEIGHRGFLELGGAWLVNQAIEATAGSRS